MAVKAMSFKLEENTIQDLKSVANVFHMTMTDVVNEALAAYLSEMKSDPFYRLTANVEDASKEECQEVLDALDAMSDEDLAIASVKKYSL